MNVERLTELRDTIAKLDSQRFNMNYWAVHMKADSRPMARSQELVHDCGTCGCIGGWAEAMYAEEGKITGHVEPAAKLLGLDDETGYALFYPDNIEDYDSISQSEAVQTIDKLINTGVVDWSHCSEYRERY